MIIIVYPYWSLISMTTLPVWEDRHIPDQNKSRSGVCKDYQTGHQRISRRVDPDWGLLSISPPSSCLTFWPFYRPHRDGQSKIRQNPSTNFIVSKHRSQFFTMGFHLFKFCHHRFSMPLSVYHTHDTNVSRSCDPFTATRVV